MTIVCISPNVIPRPMDGLVQAWASAIETIPVTTGTPSTTKCRVRSTMPLIETMSLIGSPSSQGAYPSHSRTTFSKITGSRSRRSGRSLEAE